MKTSRIAKFMTAGALALGVVVAVGCGGGSTPAPAPAPAKPAEKPAEPAPAPAATAPAATDAAAPAAADGTTAPAATDAAAAATTFPGVPTTDAAGAAIGEEARSIFGTRCAACHGLTGHGDGLAAAALNPKPRSYSDVTWQDSVTDDHIAKTIVEGGAAVGKSPLMAPNPDLASKPDVVKDLVRIVRAYKGHA